MATTPTSATSPALTLDKITLERIAILHPKRRLEALEIYKEIVKETSTPTSFCRFSHTLRTIKEQDDIYALGRTKVNPVGKTAKKPKGNIVSDAPGGKSFHNYGLAIDIAFVINGDQASWSTISDWDKDHVADWMEVVRIFKRHGWEWGDRGFVDLPHFQKVEGHTPSELYKFYKAGHVDAEGYVIF